MGKAKRGRPKNARERTIKKDLEELSLKEELCGDRKEEDIDPLPYSMRAKGCKMMTIFLN